MFAEGQNRIIQQRAQERDLYGYNDRETEFDQACEDLRTLLAGGLRPLVTLKREYLGEVLKNGLNARRTYIPQLALIAGTIAVKPYLPEGEDRTVIAINGLDENSVPSKILPRLTGNPPAFRGVIYFPKGHIDPEDLEVIM